MSDRWAEGDKYEPYIGRWSRLVAREFVSWLSLPPSLRWVDVGCGTGALTDAILSNASPERVDSLDASETFLSHAKQRIVDPRVHFRISDARELPLADVSSDAAVSGLVLNFVPQPERMLKEMVRVVRPGGVIALYVWDYAGEMQLIRHFWDAAVELEPSAIDQHEGRRFPICKLDALETLFGAAGLGSVETRAIDVPTVFRDFDDYWQPFLGATGPAPGYLMALDESKRDALREALRKRLARSTAPDGTIALVARALAVRASKYRV